MMLLRREGFLIDAGRKGVCVAPLDMQQVRNLYVVRGALDVVPSDAAVASTADLRANLAAREYLSSVPTVGRARWRPRTARQHFDHRRAVEFRRGCCRIERRRGRDDAPLDATPGVSMHEGTQQSSDLDRAGPRVSERRRQLRPAP